MTDNIKPVDIDENYSEVIQIKEQYAYRFGYARPNEDLKAFKNRTLSAIASVVGNDEYNLRIYSNMIFRLLGYPYTGCREYVFEGSLLHQALRTIKIENSKYKLYIWLQVLEMVANNISTSDDASMQYWFVQRVAEALMLSGINAVICKEGVAYKFFPYSEKFIDKALVVDVLNWLDSYKKAKEQYRQALDYILMGKYNRQVVDCLRLSLELFLKQFIGNDKSLENQIKNLGAYLKEKNLSVEVSNMFSKLVDCYTKYNNEHAKHDDSVDENELDFLLYLTGSFIRFLIKLDQPVTKHADTVNE